MFGESIIWYLLVLQSGFIAVRNVLTDVLVFFVVIILMYIVLFSSSFKNSVASDYADSAVL